VELGLSSSPDIRASDHLSYSDTFGVSYNIITTSSTIKPFGMDVLDMTSSTVSVYYTT
jgi:hypothetical protein